MTSKQLVSLIAGYRFFGDNQQVQISPDQIYGAALIAQNQICNEHEPLEAVGSLALVSGQERYYFIPVAYSSPTQAIDGTTTVTIAVSNPFHVGDGVFIISQHWLVTAVDSTHVTLNTSLSDTILATGFIYHDLIAVVRIRNTKLPLTAMSGGAITWVTRRSKEEVDKNRAKFFNVGTINSFYEVYGTSVLIGFQGVPAANFTLDFSYYRKPLPSEAPSNTVDLIIPNSYDPAMYWLTIHYTFMFYVNHPLAKREAAESYKMYLESLRNLTPLKVRQQVTQSVDYTSMGWGQR